MSPATSSRCDVRYATPDDVEPICRLLVASFRSTSLPFWRVMLGSPYIAVEARPHHGVVLSVRGNICGFSGVLFADRLMDGRVERFGNLFGWCVQPDYRRYSVALIAQQLESQGVTWTNLTSRRDMVPLFLRLRFALTDERKFLCLSRPGMFLRAARSRSVRVVPTSDVTEDLLGTEAYRIFADHLGRTVDRIVFESGNATCLVVTKRVSFPWRRVSLKGIELFYASDRVFLQHNFDYIQMRLFMRDKVTGLLADERVLGFAPKQARTVESRGLFRSETLPASKVDALYSELTILP